MSTKSGSTHEIQPAKEARDCRQLQREAKEERMELKRWTPAMLLNVLINMSI